MSAHCEFHHPKAGLLLLAGLAFLQGCGSARPTQREWPTAADRAGAYFERDRVLLDYRAGAFALRRGDFAEAKTRFDDAIARIGGIITNDADAARARSLFSPERTKPFIGEPYERVMAYYYRGLLYWRDGETDNARACFRSGQVIDSNPEDGIYRADYLILDYLDGFASAKLQADGMDSLHRAREIAGDRFELPSYNPQANVLIFAEYGSGPRKYAAGQYGEQLHFLADDSPAKSARLVFADGRTVVPLPPYDDLGFQAATRGGRVMDHILGNKAYFKTGASMAGDIAFAGAAIASEQARRRERQGKDERDAERAAVGLGILGMAGKMASAATQAEADTRQWDNLPQRLSFAALQLQPGIHHARLEFIGVEGQVLEQLTQRVTFSVLGEGRDTVLFLSELKH